MSFFGFHKLLCAGLLVGMVGRPAPAQPGMEIEIGGGFHAAIDLGDDWIALPSVPTADVRATRWVNDRWGVAGRVLAGFGSGPGEFAVGERHHPVYVQIIGRYRAARTEKTALHIGFGGGVAGFGETERDGADHPVRSFTWAPHFLALEALVSRTLTDRLGIRYGATAVVPLHVHPVVLVAWQF